MDGSNLLQKSPNLRAGILCVLEMHLNVRETAIVYYYGSKIIREIEKHRKIEEGCFAWQVGGRISER